MARNVNEIKQYMTDFFMQNEAVRNHYGLDEPQYAGRGFESIFKAVSIENILFSIAAYCAFAIEKLFDLHQSEVNRLLDERLTHNLLWYAQRAMEFRYGGILDEAAAAYINTDADGQPIDEDTVAEMKIITFAAAGDDGAGKLTVKVAKGAAGEREGLSADELTAFTAYINAIKDAGVITQINTGAGTPLRVSAQVHYEPVKLSPMNHFVETAIKTLVDTVNFNAALTRNRIEDAMQGIDGIKIVNITNLQYRDAGGQWQPFGLQKVSVYGYFTVADEDLTIIYIPYVTDDI